MSAPSSLDLALLDEFSAAFARQLFLHHPDWHIYAKAIPESSAFEVHVPSTVDASKSLWISSEDEQVTVGFDRWHGHYGWSDVDPTISNQEALDTIEAILKEECAVQVFFRDGEWIGSVIVSDIDGFFDNADEWRQHGATRTYRRSWLGSLSIERQFSAQ